jgi:hypothetical protein
MGQMLGESPVWTAIINGEIATGGVSYASINNAEEMVRPLNFDNAAGGFATNAA